MTDPLSRHPTAGIRRRIIWAGVAFIVLIVAADAYEAWADYRASVARSERTLSGLSSALAEQTARMIEEIDVALQDFAAWRVSPAGQSATVGEMREHLLRRVGGFSFVHSASVLGPDGQLQATTRSRNVSEVNLSDLPAFAMQEHAAADNLYVSTPAVGRHDNYRTFALSRRLQDPGGRFEGVVVARMALEYLTRFYATVDLSPDGTIRLLRDDGIALAQYPSTTGAPAEPSAMPLNRDLAALRAHAKVQRVPGADGAETLVAIGQVEEYPLAVEVTWPIRSALRSWVADERASAFRTGALAALAVLLLFALTRALRRRDAADFRRRNLERRLSDLRKHQALGSLAAATAHDFNNVLSAIVGYAELARTSTRESADAQTLLDRLLAAAERARQLVRRVLTFDRSRGVTYAPTDLTTIVNEVLDQVRATLPDSIRLAAATQVEHAWILGDATEIHQVVMNLCTNAVQAMPAGGDLAIRVDAIEVREERALRDGRLRPGRWLRLSIADAGGGLEPAQLRRIFEPFFTTKREHAGTGLGLAVVRNIVSRMGGALDVENRPGRGACFSAYWPQVGQEPLARRASVPAVHGNGETVLVVDDDPELVTLAEDLLAMLGYEPIGFSDVRSALEAFRKDPARFDAVIADERMPVLRGTALARAIHEVRRDVPVILMTGHRESELDELARVAGVAEVIDKPLHAQDLEAGLNRALGRSRAPVTVAH